MTLPDSSVGTLSPFQWKTYSVRKPDKARLLQFLVDGLRRRDNKIVYSSCPDRAPFYLVFETPGGDRHGVLAYAFLANSKTTKNRPLDEHRFQVKYGGNLRGVLEVAVDPHALITTIFLGIDLERGIFVAADPLMNTPAPMSRSVEFKSCHVEQILDSGWAAWSRDRRLGKSKHRPTYELDEDVRTETLVGGKQERLLDLILLERIALGLDPGERHLVADRLAIRPSRYDLPSAQHGLLKELDVEPDALFDLIEGASRLKMAVRGWVAESHLEDALSAISGVTDCRRLEEEGRPDIELRWKGSAPILIECKNTLRDTYKDGSPKVDFQRTRASKGDPCSRYYSPTDFPVLAACLHSVTEEWEFRYALTADLPPHKNCDGRIANNLAVAEPVFASRPESVFDKCSATAV